MRELLKFARPLSLVPEMFGGSMFAQVPIAPVENGAGFSLGALAVKALAGQVRAPAELASTMSRASRIPH